MKVLTTFLLSSLLALISTAVAAEVLELEAQGVLSDILGEGESFGSLASRMGDRYIYRFALDSDISNATFEERNPFYNEFEYSGGEYYSRAILIDSTGTQTVFMDVSFTGVGFEDDVDLTGVSYKGELLSGEYDIFEVFAYNGFPEERETLVTFVGPSDWFPYNGSGQLPASYSPDMSRALYTVSELSIRNLDPEQELSLARVDVSDVLDIANEEVYSDFNGDAKSDFLFRNAESGRWYMSLMDGHSVGSSSFINATTSQNWAVMTINDFNGDRKDDVLLREFNTESSRWVAYQFDGTAIVDQGFVPLSVNPAWAWQRSGDLNGDGYADVLLRNIETGRWYAYLLYGRQVRSQGFVAAAPNQDWELVGLEDLNGDGKADILLYNYITGRWYGYLMNGTAVLSQGFVAAPTNPDWRIRGFQDVNGDGRADLLLRHRFTGRWYSVLMNGLSISAQGFLNATSNRDWMMQALRDLDGDGHSDLVLRHVNTGRWYGYLLRQGRNILDEDFIALTGNWNWYLTIATDLDGDANSDLLLRNQSGAWYSYLMDGLGAYSEGFTNLVSNPQWLRMWEWNER